MSEAPPRSHLEMLLLAVLQEGPRHGYAVISELRRRSSGTFDLPEGTVYPALHRLEEQGHLSSARVRVEGRERRVYRLSAGGREALAARSAQWERFASGVREVLGGQQ